MRYAGIIYDDTAAAPGLCVSFYTQGCEFHCPGCHNPETWDFKGGYEFTAETMDNILAGIKKNGITRNFAVLGGEPLHPKNQFLTAMIVRTVREAYPGIQIWIWSGYEMDQILGYSASHPHLNMILHDADRIISGPFVQEKRDITLPYRGSSNQEIWALDHEKNLWYNLTTDKNYGRAIPNVRDREE